MANTTLQIRIDEELKAQATELFNRLGMDTTTAITVFMKAAVRERGIPFEIKEDPFYSDANMKYLERIIKKVESGEEKFIEKTIEDLEAMENE